MRLSRRKLLLHAARLAATAAAAPTALLAQDQTPANAHAFTPVRPMGPMHAPPQVEAPTRPWLHPERLARFVDPLPIPPVIAPSNVGTHPTYRLQMRQIPVKLHRDLPATNLWSYGDAHLGPTIEARQNQPILIEWANDLPKQHFLPIDHNLCGAGKDLPEVRTAVHVHGAVVPPESDGYPEDWQIPGQSRTNLYPMDQEAATLWYHDHAMGIERLNQYAGLYGFFLIRDPQEDALNLPSGKYEIPLAIADRFLYADGQLRYPDSGDPEAPWIPEVYGDVILANGAIFPYLEVEPRPYRIRLLNASNSRAYRFSLSNSHPFHQIGTDQGLLPAPIEMKELMLSPAERADLILDFSSLSGTQFTLQDKNLQILQIRVASQPATAKPHPTPGLPTLLRKIEPIAPASAIRTRTFTLNEYQNPKTHTMLMLLNGQYWHDPVTEKPVLDSTEIWSFINTTQDIHPIHLHLVRFQILDRQAFDVDDYLSYQKFSFIGPASPPPANERGWKDTVQAYPETVTRIIVPFKGYPGRYVWHCHLLEHAANEMMRPFEVVAGPKLS